MNANYFQLIGTIKKAPKMLGKKENVARFTVIVEREENRFRDYLDVVAFGEQAKDAQRWLTEGTEVKVMGRIKCEPYTPKGAERPTYPIELVVEHIATTNGALVPSEQPQPAEAEPEAVPA